MQKNLWTKTALIIAVLLVFAYGIIGFPGKWNGDGLKTALLDRIHLGLDLKGGTHLILQVMVNDAVNADTDVTIERLKDTLTKANVRYGDVTKPDPVNAPERIEIQGVPPEQGGQLRTAIDQRANYSNYSQGSAPNNAS